MICELTLVRLGGFVPQIGRGEGGGRGGGFKELPPTTFLRFKLLKIYFGNSHFIPSLFNFHLVSNNMVSYDVIIASLLSNFWVL